MPNLLVYRPADVYGYLQGLGDPWAKQIDGYNYPGDGIDGSTAPHDRANSLANCAGANPPALCNYHGSLDLASDAASIQDLTERTWSLFFRANFETKLGELPLHLSAGLREERTDISSGGVGQLPVNLAKSGADPTLLVLTKSAPVPIVTDSNYSFLLPSLDTKLELTHNLHLRFDISRTLTRAALNKLTPVLNVDNLPRVNNLPARGGNPALKPFLSDNIDLGMEWYYAQNDYVAANFFYKDVTNFIVEGTQRQTINDVVDPYSNQKAVFTVTQQVNGPNARIWGWELAWQHMFGDSGFGFNANVTLPYTDKQYDASDRTTSGFAITGLANSANLVGFHDKHGLQVRVAVNRRDETLLQFGQEQNNSKFGTEPTFVNKSTQVDLSTSYDFTPQFTAFFEGLNLTNDTISQHGRYSNQLLNVYDTGRRFTLGVRFKL
jgi:TonB-dependent receptor